MKSRRLFIWLFIVMINIGIITIQTFAVTTTVVDAKPGSHHGIALLSDGTAWTFGTNYWGQLGNGSFETSGKVYPPIKVMDNVKAIDTTENGHQTAFIKTDGSLWMCGHNDTGQIGDGTTISRNIPVKIMDNVHQVSLNAQTTAIVKTDGSLWVCGEIPFDSNNYKDGDEVHTPVKVLDGVKSVCMGYDCSFVIKNDNSLWAAGHNNFKSNGEMLCGQMGAGDLDSTETLIRITTNVKKVACKWQHTAILKMDGTLWMTGDNEYGQLGDGTKVYKKTPIMIMGEVNNVEVSTRETMFQKNDGSIWICGATSLPEKMDVFNGAKSFSGGHEFFVVDAEGLLWATENQDYYPITYTKRVTTLRGGMIHLIIGNKPDETETENDSSPKKGDTFTNDSITYSVGDRTGEITLKKTSSNASKITIPNSVSYKGQNLKVTSVAPGAIQNNLKVKEVFIGENVKDIGNNGFKGCSNLKKVTGGKGLTKVGNSAFANCKKLMSVSLGNNLTDIGTKAFANCPSLTKVTIPAKVNKIGASAYLNDKKLKTITIKSTKLSSKKVGKNAFKGISAKATIKVPKKVLKAYKKWLTKKGLLKKAKIK